MTRTPDRYRYDPPRLIDGPIYVGLDFGRRHPAAVWCQYDPVFDRVFALREWMPSLGSGGFESGSQHTFRDVVLYLSGELPYERLSREPLGVLEHMAGDPEWPEMPFFIHPPTRPIKMVYWVGHEAQIQSQVAMADSEQRSAAQIWAAAGVILPEHVVPVQARELAIRKLLGVRPDGWPGLLFGRHCPILFRAFNGGLVFAKASAINPMPDRAHKDGYYDNIHDALGYAVVAMGDYRRSGSERTAQPMDSRIRPAREGQYDRLPEQPTGVPYEVRKPVFPMKRGRGVYSRR